MRFPPLLRVLAVAALPITFALAASCSSEEPPPTGTDQADNTEAKEVWATPEWKDREDWYLITQGSHLVEYDVFMALEKAGSEKPFADRENLERMGFVFAPGREELSSDERLPLGLLRDESVEDGKDYLGFTCAACHTGELEVKGTRVIVDGGQAFVETEAFFAGLQRALRDTLEDDDRAARFCDALEDEEASCMERLGAAAERVDGLRARNVASVEAGAGRIDAFSQILNEVFGDQLGGEAPKPLSVPVSIPHVWDAPRLSCVQTNCSSRNSFTRNVGEVLGVFGHARFTEAGLTTTAQGRNLYDLEKSLETLESPRWDEDLLGEIDDDLRKAGRALFEDNCAGCHTEPYRFDDHQEAGAEAHFVVETGAGRTVVLWKATTTRYDVVGTDPAFIQDHGARMVDSPQLTAFFDELIRQSVAAKLGAGATPEQIQAGVDAQRAQMIAAGLRTADGKIASIAMLGAVTTALEYGLVAGLAEGRSPDEVRRELEFYRAPVGSTDLTSYRARPLNGIAFTAPFGHTGAWPTLRDVLDPPSERPKRFPVRPRSFDPDRVGLDISAVGDDESPFIHDTTLRGNQRDGHEYGTELSDDEKDAIVEYLKSI